MKQIEEIIEFCRYRGGDEDDAEGLANKINKFIKQNEIRMLNKVRKIYCKEISKLKEQI